MSNEIDRLKMEKGYWRKKAKRYGNNIEVMQVEIDTLARRLAECEEAMQEFVDRCESGAVRSRYTYSKFKSILTACSEDKDEN